MDRILIVDDDSDATEAMADFLKHEGFEVSVASDGQRALANLRSANALPSVILLDLTMPVMNGWQFRQAQLADPSLASVPVIILTAAAASESSISRLHPAGFLRKPVPPQALLNLVGSVCR